MARTGRPRHSRTKTCPRCGDTFTAKDTRTVYCSKRCAFMRRPLTAQSKDCASCGENFTKPAHYTYKQWDAIQHCSRKCAQANRPRAVVACTNCTREFHPSHPSRSVNRFCTQKCYGEWIRAQASLDPCANGAFSAAAQRVLLERAGHRCQTCGSGDDLEFDHVILQAAGGLGTVDNGQVLCQPCHMAKTLAERELMARLLREHYIRSGHEGLLPAIHLQSAQPRLNR